MANKNFRVRATLEAQDRASGAFGRVGSASSRLVASWAALAAGAAAAGAAIVALGRELGRSVQAFNRQQEAVTRLNSALRLAGADDSFSQGLQRQASALQEVTKFGDEAISSAQSLLVTLGVAPEQLGTATQATVDLASALGIDLQSAARNVGRTVGGFAGELGEVIPELKDLSAEALQAGAGIDLLAEKFRGAAIDAGETFEAALTRVQNALGDTREAIGEGVAGSEELIEATDRVAQAIANFNEGLNRSPGFLAALGSGIANLTANVINLVSSIQSVSVEEFNRRLAAQREAAEGAAEGVRTLTEAERRLAEQQFDAVQSSDAFIAGLERLGVVLDAEVNAELEKNREFLEAAEQAYRRGEISSADFARAQEAVAEAERLAAEATRSNVEAVDQQSVSYDRATQSVLEFESAQRRSAAATREVTTAAREQVSVTGGGTGRGASLAGIAAFAEATGGAGNLRAARAVRTGGPVSTQFGLIRIRTGPDGRRFSQVVG